MESIEQVFLEVRTIEGRRLPEVLATTDSVRPGDLSEAVSWFAELETESAIRFDRFSVFFHPLPSGDFALGMIQSGQKTLLSLLTAPRSFFVRILLVPQRTLLRKGNNPVALFEELRRQGRLPIVSKPPRRLRALVPSDVPSLLNRPVLESLSSDPGPAALAGLNQSFCDHISTLLMPNRNRSILSLIGGLIDLLPIRFRTELTFSSDLHFSPNHPFRLIALAQSPRSAIRLSTSSGLPLVLWSRPENASSGEVRLPDPWPRFVFQLLHEGRYSFFQEQLEAEYREIVSVRRATHSLPFDLETLHEVADSWIGALNGKTTGTGWRDPSSSSAEILRRASSVDHLAPVIDRESDSLNRQREVVRSAVDAQTRSTFFSLKNEPRTPSRHSGDSFEENACQALLDQLKTSVHRVLAGDETAVGTVRTDWQTIRGQVAWDEQDRLREEYLALICSSLEEPSKHDRPRQPRNSFRMLELMLVFLEGTGKSSKSSAPRP